MNSKNNFNNRCYKIVSSIPKGKISTYGDIAKVLGTKAYQAVGNAMAKNPNLISIPCHRIVRSNSMVGGYVLGTDKKVKLLKREGVAVRNGKIVDFDNIIHRFK